VTRLHRGILFAFLLEAALVAAIWGAVELAEHPWGRWVAICVSLAALPFLALKEQR